MEKFLKLAATAWAKATLNVQRFANAYVQARAFRAEEARERFAVAYPMFGPREWRRLELIGTGRLLPQFMFKSDSFVGKLIRMNESMRWQKALVSASDNGTLRIDRGNGPEKVKLTELTEKEEKALMFLLSEADTDMKPCSLLTKFRSMVVRVNKQNASRKRPEWEIRESAGRVYAHFNRACSLDRAELADILKTLDRGKKGVGAQGHGASLLLNKLVQAIVELEALRDDEWEFEENHGPHRECWTAKDEEEHDKLLVAIRKSRCRVRDLAREATGDDNLEV